MTLRVFILCSLCFIVSCFSASAQKQDTTIYTIVEQPAEPVGGYEAFFKFIKKNLKYSKTARPMGVEGKIFIQFVVEKDGSISNLGMRDGFSNGWTPKDIAFIKSSSWQAAKNQGKLVRQRIIVPIFIHVR